MAFKEHLKRAFFEWGAIAAASISAFCLLVWAAYVTGAVKLAGDDMYGPMHVGEWMYFAHEDGAITVSNGLESIEQVDSWRSLGGRRAEKDLRWHAPGLVFQYYVPFLSNYHRWLLRCSMLIPAFAFAIIAAIFGFRCRRIQKRLTAEPNS